MLKLLEEAAAGGPQFFNLVPWIVFFPVIGLLINIIFGGRILNSGKSGEKLVGAIASTASGLAFVVALLQAVSLLGHPEGTVIHLADWIVLGSGEGALSIPWAFQVDTLSVTMMLVVSGVGTLIHIYAIGYMHEDVRHNGDPSRFRRFFVFLNLFIAFMMVLISGNNYMMLFVGWEGVGLCSFLLIGFWYDKGKDGIGNAMAAKKAMVTNRVGDFGFLLAAFTIYWNFGTFNFHEIFEKVPEVAAANPGALWWITIFMLIGVTGKSAQLPLYVWLPDAMAGPTPVSALIHAATMVTAGVYLVARSGEIYHAVPQAQYIVSMVGAVTALFAATIAVGQFDIKKVLAYSTISQLGFMVAAVGMGAFVAGMFHLVTHAFFKALLFLGSGSVIQGMERGEHHVEHDTKLRKGHHGHGVDPQDMRNMGGLKDKMPTTFWVYLIGSVALAGIPPLAGFWSKDEILAEGSHLNPAAYWLLTAAAFLTAFYMTRQVLMVFFGKGRTAAAEHAQESPSVMTVPLIILALLSALGGLMNLPFHGFHNFTLWIEHTLGELVHEGEFNLLVAGVSTLLALGAVALGYWLYNPRRYAAFWDQPAAKRPDDPLRGMIGPLFEALNNKWWVDELYWAVILNPYIALSRFLADVIDWRFWHDWFHDTVIAGGYRLLTQLLALRVDLGGIDRVANGLASGMQWIAARLRGLQTGFIRNYALAVFLGVVAILSYLLLR
ncbi:MAG: NADH-quinone oxidoreductase subunit L [Chloroflexota bacterium]